MIKTIQKVFCDRCKREIEGIEAYPTLNFCTKSIKNEESSTVLALDLCKSCANSICMAIRDDCYGHSNEDVIKKILDICPKGDYSDSWEGLK